MTDRCTAGSSDAAKSAHALMVWLSKATQAEIARDLAPALKGDRALQAARELWARAPYIRRELWLDTPAPGRELDEDEGGIPRLESRLSAYLSRQGERGRTAASQLRPFMVGPGPARERLWARAKLPVLLADVLLEDALERRSAGSLPALAVGDCLDLVGFQARGLNADVGTGLICRGRGSAVGRIELGPLSDPLLSKALAGSTLLGSLGGHRLVRCLEQVAFWRVQEGLPSPGCLEFRRGWAELAELARFSSGQERERLPGLVYAGAHLCRQAGAHFNLWSVLYDPSRVPPLSITLGPIFLPAACRVYQRGDIRRLLVPVVDLPPMCGRANDYGPIATMQTLFMIHLAERSRALQRDGGIRIHQAEWLQWAREAGAPGLNVDSIRETWIQGDGSALPFLKDLGDGLLTLAPWHGAALASLLAMGRTREERAKGGRNRHRPVGRRK